MSPGLFSPSRQRPNSTRCVITVIGKAWIPQATLISWSFVENRLVHNLGDGQTALIISSRFLVWVFRPLILPGPCYSITATEIFVASDVYLVLVRRVGVPEFLFLWGVMILLATGKLWVHKLTVLGAIRGFEYHFTDKYGVFVVE